MTVINLVSGAIYSKDTASREKIQIYVLAAVFLALLYNSPSGLVIYWILNNLFSLAKNVVLRMKNPGKVLQVIVDALLGLFACYFLFFNHGAIKKRVLLAVFAAVVILFPVLKSLLRFARNDGKFRWLSLSKPHQSGKAISSASGSHSELVSESSGKQMLNQSVCRQARVQYDKFSKSQFSLFIFSALGLALLCGFYLPSSTIATSPTEFSFLCEGADSPLAYVWSSLFTFLGFFAIWPALIYFMFGEKVKQWESAIFFVAFLTALADVFIFKADYGTVNVLFELNNRVVLKSNSVQSFLSIAFAVFSCCLIFVLRKFRKINVASGFLFALCFTESVTSVLNVYSINKSFVTFSENRKKNSIPAENIDTDDEIKPVYHFSKTGKNVVVIFLDRAINLFFPFALQDLPELKELMRGFVYFPNTLSFGK